MIKFFFVGSLFYASLFLFRYIVILSIAKYYKEDYKAYFDFNFSIIILEIIFSGFIFSGIFWASSFFENKPVVTEIVIILIISLIPTYLFLINPIQHLIFNRDYVVDDRISNLIRDKTLSYNVKIINKNVINAFATGVIPFSKTVLIGSPLIKALKEEELISIIYHEIGHLKLNHLRNLYLINLSIAVFSYYLHLLRFHVVKTDNLIVDILSVGVTGGIVGLLVCYLPGKLQYFFEFKADRFSAEKNGRDNIINALKKLDELSNGEVSKGGLTHPTLEKRIKNLQSK